MKGEKLDQQYFNIVNHILENKIFNKIKKFSHHGTDRLTHSKRVSYMSYKITKRIGLDFKSAAVAGLLHDFYLYVDQKKIIKYIKAQYIHPKEASKNAVFYFNISKKEQNIIETHMFPITFKPSKHLEGWVIIMADKIVAFYEYGINYKNRVCSFFNSVLYKSSKKKTKTFT